ncbi:DUF397 domain-containing protein [Thermostaphylospora chromogena]|uniref:DUF397 domain-containing protein n=1 Tax=Thermostaphylospora chromogena TaxID=35622 RepID=A0A1H1FE83_9ACTN|nr:protein of unknown function [Thermostaphylospora chromogena]
MTTTHFTGVAEDGVADATVTTVDFSQAIWRKSSRSGNGGNCVEVAVVGDTIGVRDSKRPADGILAFGSREWRAFIMGVKDGEFDSAS